MTDAQSNIVTMRRPQAAAGSFDEFWQECPGVMRNRSSKGLTRALWTEITTNGRDCRVPLKDGGQTVEIINVHMKATPEEILAGLQRYIEPHYDPQTFRYDEFLCGAAVFLNQGRWES